MVKPKNLKEEKITAEELHKAVDDGQIRRLSVREFWKLMGVPSEYGHYFEEIAPTNAEKLLGNAIVMPTLQEILREYFKAAIPVWEKEQEYILEEDKDVLAVKPFAEEGIEKIVALVIPDRTVKNTKPLKSRRKYYTTAKNLMINNDFEG